MFNELLIRDARCVVHLGDHKEFVKAVKRRETTMRA